MPLDDPNFTAVLGNRKLAYLPRFERIIERSGDDPARIPKVLSWNWAALLGTGFWLLYHRMYLQGLVLVGASLVVSAVFETGVLFCLFTGGAALGLYGDSQLLMHVRKQAAERAKLTSEEDLARFDAKHANSSPLLGWGMVPVVILAAGLTNRELRAELFGGGASVCDDKRIHAAIVRDLLSSEDMMKLMHYIPALGLVFSGEGAPVEISLNGPGMVMSAEEGARGNYTYCVGEMVDQVQPGFTHTSPDLNVGLARHIRALYAVKWRVLRDSKGELRWEVTSGDITKVGMAPGWKQYAPDPEKLRAEAAAKKAEAEARQRGEEQRIAAERQRAEQERAQREAEALRARQIEQQREADARRRAQEQEQLRREAEATRRREDEQQRQTDGRSKKSAVAQAFGRMVEPTLVLERPWNCALNHPFLTELNFIPLPDRSVRVEACGKQPHERQTACMEFRANLDSSGAFYAFSASATPGTRMEGIFTVREGASNYRMGYVERGVPGNTLDTRTMCRPAR